MFQGFPEKSLSFLKAVAANNNKEWFDAHKHEYTTLILEPSRAFVVEMGEHLQALVPTVNAVPKVNGSLFRIYRDSRFHRSDPIKDHIGIIFWQGNGPRMASSSFYMHFDAQTLFFAVGIRKFKPEMLAAYRDYIKEAKHRESLHMILETLKSKGYRLPEPRYKRYPKGFNADIPHACLSLFDAMYAYTVMKPEKAFFTADLPMMAYTIYEELFDLQQWVYEMTLTTAQ
jgi:uncharacterized protein (TIGR02453 family)